MVRGTRTDTDVVFLRNGIFFGEDALFCLIVELDRSTEILFGTNTHRLAFLECHIIENIHFERSTQPFVLLFNENRETVTSSFGWIKWKQKCKYWIYQIPRPRPGDTNHLGTYFPSNLNSDRLLATRDAFVVWSGWASSCEDSNQNWPTDKQMRIHSDICLRSQTCWRQWSAKLKIKLIEAFAVAAHVQNGLTSLISETGSFNFFRGCRSNT